jgi:hypothetical protein
MSRYPSTATRSTYRACQRSHPRKAEPAGTAASGMTGTLVGGYSVDHRATSHPAHGARSRRRPPTSRRGRAGRGSEVRFRQVVVTIGFPAGGGGKPFRRGHQSATYAREFSRSTPAGQRSAKFAFQNEGDMTGRRACAQNDLVGPPPLRTPTSPRAAAPATASSAARERSRPYEGNQRSKTRPLKPGRTTSMACQWATLMPKRIAWVCV